MKKAGSYISMLILALFLFPLAEKAGHDFEHFNDEHCGIKDTHYCEAEHDCTICDYVLSSSSTPPEPPSEVCNVVRISENSVSLFTSDIISFPKFTFLLRGPPVV